MSDVVVVNRIECPILSKRVERNNQIVFDVNGIVP